jgi:cytochrome d ubiquinol oxidase subunit I
MEGLYAGQHGAPEAIGGLYWGNSLHGALRIPDGLSLLAHLDPHSYVAGLKGVPADERPPVNIVHLAFDGMVGIGFLLLLLGLWLTRSWIRRRDMPASLWFLRAVAASGVAAVVAMEAGWVTTEVGRQPWIVYRLLRVDQAVNPADGLGWGLPALVVVYAVLTAAIVYVLRYMLRRHPVGTAPQDSDLRQTGVA